ncbi:ABC transporter [Colletotrichum gloeosporioides Cg-14]|uniref:ABC transporter n=1 Tax=Colletotrichum gloeosporioides (strain Cg-14) TaxID=1237896 RepID=T0K768_COLGC|nr:ABC transporter [Colletotrichum gloeosporioides Cg-14]
MLFGKPSKGEKNAGVIYSSEQQPAGQVEAQLIDASSTEPSSESASTSGRKQRNWSQRLNPLKAKYVPLVPDRRQPSLEAGAGFFSRLLFTWVTPLMHVGYQRPLEQNDIWEVNPERSAEVLEVKFRDAFQRHTANGSSRPLLRALLSTFKKEFVVGALCQLGSTVASTISPFLLKYLIAFATEAYNAAKNGSAAPNIGYGVGLVIIITFLQIVMTLSINHFLYFGMTVGGEARAVLMSVIFDKAMKISGRAKAGGSSDVALPPSDIAPGSDEEKKWYKKLLRTKKNQDKSKKPETKSEGESGWSNGRIVNLMSTDTYRIDTASGFFHLLWGSPLNIVITMVLLLINLTYSALPGLGLLFICSPALGLAFKALFKRRFAINQITDARVSLTQEVMQAMRFVKLFGWETSFLGRIDEIRKKEIRSIQILMSIRDGIQAVSMSMPVFASMLSFITYSLTSHSLNPAPIFSSLALFNNLRMPLNMLPMVIGQAVDALASVKRIEEFLLAEESTDDVQYDYNGQNAITVEDATFTWEQTLAQAREGLSDREDGPGVRTQSTITMLEPFHIPNLNLAIGRSELVAVIGSVGSGKTSLLAALAGEMRQTGGCLTLGATRAFCPQYAWIQNASVRDNIIFGREFDREWYDKVTEACALRTDFEMLPDGDRTEIGERGITVSGGQKQRINIARAIYFNADIVLMDDPLSAVDIHVGKQIMDKAICGLLSNKCRILATHQLHVLNRSDRIIWLDEGHIKAEGSYEELMSGNEEFEKLMALTHVDEQASELHGSQQDPNTVSAEEHVNEEEKLVKIETHKSTAALMQAEERALDAVSWSVYGAYIRASGSILVAPLVIGFLVLAQGCNIMTSLWLSWWTADQFSSVDEDTYIAVYAGLGAAQAILMFCFAVSISIFGTRASKVMLKRAMTKVLRAPMSFFDTTPLGRITNRFSKDIDVMDNTLTDSLRMYLLTISMLLSTMALILAYYYYFVAALVPLLIIFLFSANYYRSSAREIKRHEAILRSHVFAKFSEAVYGTSTIRAYGLRDQFTAVLRKQIDDFDGAYFLTFGNQRWLSLRLDAIGLVTIFVLGMLVVTSRFTVNPSIGGLVLSYMLGIMGQFQFAVRQMAEVENDMNNTERIHYYGTGLEEEAPLHIGEGMPKSWPSQGEIVFDHVQMRYRAGLPLVLKDIHMHIKGGERLGVVGRTGAGKSSIMSMLFRLVEISSGSITIDGVNISTIGLQDLRSRLAIIPQDPTLFKGTIRSNLDPFDEQSDIELWAALRQANLVTDTSSPGALGLQSVVEEEGLNFSLGQRQLMALARALVRDAKIIVCDEATSSVDLATDQKVQQTMESFRGKTLLCIAHRLETIIGYDRICVLDKGEVAELGTPLELFDKGGMFTSMCEKGSIKRADILEKMTSK